MHYRSEIDGLRTIAVLPVLMFHAGVSFMPGGFLGVDVFFVISGFLITSILVKELEQGRFSLLGFYERRARRILPALFFVLAVTSFFAVLMLSPTDLKDYSQSVVAVAVFASNIYFYLTNDYFSTNAEELPLLHTWSLAVEEQYYVIFPVLLAFLWKGRKRVLASIWLLAISSFIFSIIIHPVDNNANFYLLPSRAWELLAGALVALYIKHFDNWPNSIRQFVSAMSLLVLMWSLLVIQKGGAHPGWITLAPVLSTALIIAVSENTLVARLLSMRPLVAIGLISYSLYLWHQPLYAFLRIKMTSEPELWQFGILTLIAFSLSVLSYKWVESPFRSKGFLSRKKILHGSAFMLVAVAFLGSWGHVKEGFPERFYEPEVFSSTEFSPFRQACHSSSGVINSFKPECEYNGAQGAHWAVLGDSHGVELAHALALRLKTQEGLAQLTYSGCPPALTFDTPVKGCSRWLNDTLEEILSRPELTNVVLAYRHLAYLTPIHNKYKSSAAEIAEHSPRKVFKQDSKLVSAAELKALYWNSFRELVKRLIEGGKTVYVLYPVPEPEADIDKLITPTTIFQRGNSDKKAKIAVELYEFQSQSIKRELDSIKKESDFVPIVPKDVLCDDNFCYAVKSGQAMFFDDNHLSVAGARLVSELIYEKRSN